MSEASITSTNAGARTSGWVPACILMLVVLLWPAFWNGFPIIFHDTGGYLARPFEETLATGRAAIYGAFLLIGIKYEFWPNIVIQSAPRCLAHSVDAAPAWLRRPALARDAGRGRALRAHGPALVRSAADAGHPGSARGARCRAAGVSCGGSATMGTRDPCRRRSRWQSQATCRSSPWRSGLSRCWASCALLGSRVCRCPGPASLCPR